MTKEEEEKVNEAMDLVVNGDHIRMSERMLFDICKSRRITGKNIIETTSDKGNKLTAFFTENEDGDTVVVDFAYNLEY